MEANNNIKSTFSGHETFACKSLWLKKGYDFVKDGHSFNDEDTVVALGVGKNMVSSIRYWLRAFGMINQDNEISPLADFIFDTETGCDPFVEDSQTLWLLHWNLIYTNYATIYRQIFLNFHKERKEFLIDGMPFTLEYMFAYFTNPYAAFYNLPPEEKVLKIDLSLLPIEVHTLNVERLTCYDCDKK